MSKKLTYFYSVGIAVLLIYTSFFLALKKDKEAEAQISLRTPFATQISSIILCCNGLLFYGGGQLQSPAQGSFIFQWPNMIPIPAIGTGLYSWWSVMPSTKVLGDAIIGGTCQNISSYCAPNITANYSVMQMGTTALPI